MPAQIPGTFFPEVLFLQSVENSEQLPPDDGTEVAFAGRSNAGKSSALNAICGRRSLARTSKLPGRTRLINFFGVGPSRRLVDLPGYGYAKVPAAVRARWQQSIAAFFGERRSLRGVVMVADVRQPLGPLDRQMLDWCQSAGLPVHLLLSKCDKLSHGAAAEALAATRRMLEAADGGFVVSVQLFSALTREGVNEAQVRVLQWLGVAGEQDKKNPGNKGRESGAYKQSRKNVRDFPRSGRRSG